jgi:hypothetical protein
MKPDNQHFHVNVLVSIPADLFLRDEMINFNIMILKVIFFILRKSPYFVSLA